MKKLVALAAVLGLLAVYMPSAKAAGIEAGQSMVSLTGGVAIPAQKSGVKIEDDGVTYGELYWGNTGGQFGLSYMYFVHEYIGVGLELNDAFFGEKEQTIVSIPGVGKDSFKSKMNTFNAMVTARVNANPKNSLRVYVPFGLGLTHAKGKIKEIWNDFYDPADSGSESYSSSNNSFGWFVGLGAEADVTDHFALGAEVRYAGFRVDTDKYDDEGSVNGKKNYGYTSILVKASYRF